VVSCAVGRGLRESLALVAGMVVGDLVYFYCAVVGLAALARTSGDVFVWVKLAGAAYLVWLGLRLWLQRPAIGVEKPGSTPPRRGGWRNVLGGLAVTLGNPKAIAFYAGLLPTFIDLERLSLAESVTMGGIVVLIVAGILAAYAAAAAGSRRFLAEAGRIKLMNRAAGTMMIGAGLSVAVR